DTTILDELPRKDARVEFIHREILRLQKELTIKGTTLDVRIGKPVEIWKQLIENYDIRSVWANKDYEPYAQDRDKVIYDLLRNHGIKFIAKKDHVIFEKDEIIKDNGEQYVVYTTYSRLWKQTLTREDLSPFRSEEKSNWNKTDSKEIPGLEQIGF